MIKANAEKSKHLETATIKVYGHEIDLVNLRSENYTEGSSGLGAPLEDALARDLTFNSLFYNINEKKVEDFTGKGVDDLRDGVCRTPIQPEKTFVDDPVRVLRTIRFANRFEFTIDPELVEATKLPSVRVSPII